MLAYLLLTSTDGAPIADRLAKLARDPELRMRMAEAGRERVKNHFTIERDVASFEWLYDDALEIRNSADAAH